MPGQNELTDGCMFMNERNGKHGDEDTVYHLRFATEGGGNSYLNYNYSDYNKSQNLQSQNSRNNINMSEKVYEDSFEEMAHYGHEARFSSKNKDLHVGDRSWPSNGFTGQAFVNGFRKTGYCEKGLTHDDGNYDDFKGDRNGLRDSEGPRTGYNWKKSKLALKAYGSLEADKDGYLNGGHFHDYNEGVSESGHTSRRPDLNRSLSYTANSLESGPIGSTRSAYMAQRSLSDYSHYYKV